MALTIYYLITKTGVTPYASVPSGLNPLTIAGVEVPEPKYSSNNVNGDDTFDVTSATFEMPADYPPGGSAYISGWHSISVPDNFVIPPGLESANDKVLDTAKEGLIDVIKDAIAEAYNIPAVNYIKTGTDLYNAESTFFTKKFAAWRNLDNNQISLATYDQITTQNTNNLVLDALGVAGLPSIIVNVLKTRRFHRPRLLFTKPLVPARREPTVFRVF